MAFLNEKNKNKLVSGLISLFILLIGLWIKSFFSKSNTQLEKQSHPTQNLATNDRDSPTLYSKKTGTIKPITKKSKHITSNSQGLNKSETGTSKIEVKENNGFINNGGQNNTYNQTIVPKQQRHITEDDKSRLLTWLKGIDTKTIIIVTRQKDEESLTYSNELNNFLNTIGYNTGFANIGMLVNNNQKTPFDLNISNNGTPNLIVNPLR